MAIGMLEGLRAGIADARTDEELRLRRQREEREAAMREQEFGLRKREFDMREAQHAATMEQLGMQLQQQRGVNSAMENIRGLTKREREDKAHVDAGLPGPVRPDVTERDYNREFMGLAAAKGDVEGMAKLQLRDKILSAHEMAQRMYADPTMREKVYEYLDKSAVPLKVIRGERDQKTGRMKTPDTLQFDDGYTHKLNEADTLRMLQGIALSKAGLQTEADAAFEGVNKRLRDAVDVGNKRTLTAYDMQARTDDRMTDNELNRERLGLLKDQRQATRAGAGREVPPDILRELSVLEQQYIQADPKARPAIERQYQMVLSRAGAAVGKPMGLPNARPPVSEPKVNPDGSVVKDGVLYLPNPKKPGEFTPAKGIGPSDVDRAVAAYREQNGAGAAAPAAPAQPQGLVRPVRPPGASADYGVYGTPGYEQYLRDMQLQHLIDSRSPSTGLHMLTRPVDFGKYNSVR